MSDSEIERLQELLYLLEESVNKDDNLTDYGKEQILQAIRVINEQIR